MRRNLTLVALLAALALVVAACGGDTEDTTTSEAEAATVLDVAIEAGQFSTLIAAIEAADLVETLEGEGPFTVLAPTNAAFEDALEALGLTADELLASDLLTDILTYHVLPIEADSQAVSALDGESVETVNGDSIAIAVDGGTITIDGTAEVVSADLEAENGIVHVINAVLLPADVAEALGAGAPEETTTTTEAPAETTTTTEAPAETTTTEAASNTIVDIVIAATEGDPAEFTILLEAVLAADLADLLAGDGPSGEGLTVFAPTDAAFTAALEALGLTLEELLASEDLPTILAYHVVDGTFLADDVIGIAPADVPTLAEATVAIEVVDGAVMVNDATVVQADVVADNGVIHVIDTVLLPPTEG